MTNSKKEKNSVKLFIHAFRQVRAYILENGLKPGDLLPTEQQLCQEIGVSRNVLREAIKSMELIGLVEACAGRGTQVKAFNLDFVFQNVLFFNMDKDDIRVREMFEIRKMLELAFMRRAFESITREDVGRMREIVGRMREHFEMGTAFSQEDMEFHQTLFSGVGNDLLISMLDAVWQVDKGFQLEEKLPHFNSSVTKHEAIVTALERYDYMAFARAMISHYSSGKYAGADAGYEEY